MKKRFMPCVMAVLLACLLLLPGTGALAEDSAEPGPGDAAAPVVADMIAYYAAYQDAALTDLMRLYWDLHGIDPGQAEVWRKVLETWDELDGRLFADGMLPDGLPEDGSLCIVALGFGLNDDGTMRAELVGRLETVLENAGRYPEARILCTGGGTAREKPDATEAGAMADWLKEKGIPGERILVEDRSRNTVENARFSLELLAEQAPDVRKIAVITSDYHVARGWLLFHAQTLLNADRTGEAQPEVAAGAGFRTGRDAGEDTAQLANSLYGIAGVKKPKEAPKLSGLERLEIRGDAEQGFRVTAVYDSGFSRDVTDLSESIDSGPDPSGRYFRTVLYSENGTERTARIQTGQEPVPEPTREPEGGRKKEWIPVGWAVAGFVLLTAVLVGAAAALYMKNSMTAGQTDVRDRKKDKKDRS